ARQHSASRTGLPLSLGDLLQGEDIQSLIRDEPLELQILGLEFLQALELVGLHAAILGFPAMIRLLGDLELLADLGDCLPAAKVHLGLAQLLDDLLRGVLPAFRHSSSLLRRFLLRRLSFTLVQFSGGTPSGLPTS